MHVFAPVPVRQCISSCDFNSPSILILSMALITYDMSVGSRVGDHVAARLLPIADGAVDGEVDAFEGAAAAEDGAVPDGGPGDGLEDGAGLPAGAGKGRGRGRGRGRGAAAKPKAKVKAKPKVVLGAILVIRHQIGCHTFNTSM